MTDYEIIASLAAVAAVVAYLWVAYLWLRHLQRPPRQSDLHNPDVWDGKALDVTPLQPVVESVRRDYLAAGRHPAKEVFMHKRLLELARRTIGHLAYFHPAEPTEHPSASDR